MELLIVLGLIVVFIIFKKPSKPLGKVTCLYHRWQYDEQGLMICSVCNKRPNADDM